MTVRRGTTLVLVAWLLLLISSCHDGDGDDVVTRPPTDNSLPASLTLVDLPAGTFTMGGATMAEDAPEVQVTLGAFAISATEVTNQQYLAFLNAAYTAGWLVVEEEQIADPCGQYSELVVRGAGSAPTPGRSTCSWERPAVAPATDMPSTLTTRAGSRSTRRRAPSRCWTQPGRHGPSTG